MKRFLPAVLLLILLNLAAFAQSAPSLEGVWLGELHVNAFTLHLAFHFSKNGNGYTGTVDSMDQGVHGIPIRTVTLEGANIALAVPSIAGSYKGTLSADGNTMDGSWSQGPGTLPLQLKRTTVAAAAAPRRPQNPVKPYPYREEEVSFSNPGADITLAGTLTAPQGRGPFTTVLLITGSGPQNRDEELLGHKPFLVLSDYLTRQGIAVLRVDDRGTAKSTGNFNGSTTLDFATDAEAAIAYLKTRPEVDLKHIGVLGHSEGGMIAPMIAARRKDVAFVVMLAGTGVPGRELLPEQIRQSNLAAGMPETQAEATAALERITLKIIEDEPDNGVAARKLREKLAGVMPENQISSTIATALSPWFRTLLAYDPAPALRQLKCPVLALNGSLDRQVSAKQNLPAIRAALEQGGNPHFEVVEMPGLNHLFQTAKTGSPSEYAQIEETMAPAALEKIASWIKSNQ